MKKLKGLSPTSMLVLTSAFLAVLSISISNINLHNATASPDTNTTSSAASSSEPISEKVVYVVKEYDGKVAVFEKGKDKPFKITGVSTSDLPSADKEILKNGIEADNQKKLSTILEDYCS